MAERTILVPHFDILDLSKVYLNHVEKNAILLKRLGRLRLLTPDSLFTGVCGIPLETIKENGADFLGRTSTFAFALREMQEPYDSVWNYAEGGNPSIVLVYDGLKMTPAEDMPSVFRFKRGITPRDALIAAFEIKF